MTSNMRVVPAEESWEPEQPKTGFSFEAVRQQGLRDMKEALRRADEALEEANNWAQTLAVIPADVKPLIIDLSRKVKRVQLEVADLK